MTNVALLFTFLFFLPVCVCAQDNNEEINTEMTDTQLSNDQQIFLSTRSDIKDHGKIILQWSCAALKAEQFFTIERSKNGKDFEVIGGIKGKKGQGIFEFTDERPSTTNNFYRIRSIDAANKEVFSKIISKGIATARFSSFYPNPVEKYLIVRTETPVEIKIVDQLNKVRISKQLEMGLQLVDVGQLEKGLYFITLFHKASNRVISDKLIKH
jgi:hypothetical protein